MLRKRRNVMLAKKAGDNNWRPISLLNVDAKIMSKAIATRIINILPKIIHHNQTGFIEDCYIGDQFST